MAELPPGTFDDVLNRMGFNAAARARLTDVDRENLQLTDLAAFITDDDFDDLISSLRKPGRTVEGNPDPGVYVASRAVDGLKTGCYIARHNCEHSVI